jgi:hypothetical protein
MRDQHFSTVSRALKTEIFKENKSLNCAEDVVNALNKNYTYLNEQKNEKNKTSNISMAIYYKPILSSPITHKYRMIEESSNYYNFTNTASGLCTSIFSDLDDLSPVDSVLSDEQEKVSLNFEATENIVIDKTNEELGKFTKNMSKKLFFYKDLLKDPQRDKQVAQNLPTTTTNANLSKPDFCYYQCIECKAIPKYSIKDIEKLNQSKLLNELSNHGHRKSRKMPNNQWRDTEQGKVELSNHYKYFHNIVE